MSLIKVHNDDRLLEDFGIVREDKTSYCLVDLYENGLEKVYKGDYSPVIKIKAVWMDKDLMADCGVADTFEKKVAGLNSIELDEGSGYYFPYLTRDDVTFIQSSVKYPLDIVFLRDYEVVKIACTEVNSEDKYSCEDVTGVIEFRRGFCDKNNVVVGDRVLLAAVSELDRKEVEDERALGLLEDF